MLFRTNLLVSLEAVKTEVLAEDAEALLFLLQDPCLGVAHLLEADNAELYLTNLLDYVEGSQDKFYFLISLHYQYSYYNMNCGQWVRYHFWKLQTKKITLTLYFVVRNKKVLYVLKGATTFAWFPYVLWPFALLRYLLYTSSALNAICSLLSFALWLNMSFALWLNTSFAL